MLDYAFTISRRAPVFWRMLKRLNEILVARFGDSDEATTCSENDPSRTFPVPSPKRALDDPPTRIERNGVLEAVGARDVLSLLAGTVEEWSWRRPLNRIVNSELEVESSYGETLPDGSKSSASFGDSFGDTGIESGISKIYTVDFKL